MALQEMEAAATRKETKQNLVRAIERVAKRLGNTPAICRKCYVHPAIIDGYLDGTLVDSLKRKVRKAAADPNDLTEDEESVLALLERRLADEAKKTTLEEDLTRSLKHAKKKKRTPAKGAAA